MSSYIAFCPPFFLAVLCDRVPFTWQLLFPKYMGKCHWMLMHHNAPLISVHCQSRLIHIPCKMSVKGPQTIVTNNGSGIVCAQNPPSNFQDNMYALLHIRIDPTCYSQSKFSVKIQKDNIVCPPSIIHNHFLCRYMENTVLICIRSMNWQIPAGHLNPQLVMSCSSLEDHQWSTFVPAYITTQVPLHLFGSRSENLPNDRPLADERSDDRVSCVNLD